jgi:hypothetical protein
LSRREGLATALVGVALLGALGAGLVGGSPGDVRFLGIGGVDHHGTLWTWWALRDAVAAGDGSRLVHTPWFFHPYGQALYRHTGANLVDAALGLLAAPLGRVAGHDAALLLVLALNGLGGWLGARRLGLARPGLAGLALLVSPWPLYELAEGRPTQALVACAPLYVAEVGRLARGRRGEGALVAPRDAPGRGAWWRAGAWLAALGYCYWFHALFAGLATLAWLGWEALPGRREPSIDLRHVLVGLGGAALVAAALATPVAGPLVRESVAGLAPGLMDLADPRGILLTSFQPRWWAVGYLDEHALVLTQRALPWTALPVAVWVAWREPGRRGLVLAAGLAVVLATGPVLLLPGRVLPEPLYVALAELLPPLRRLWQPARFLAVPAVLLALWAATGRRGVLVVVALALEATLDGLLPLPTWDAAVPAGYRCLAAGSDGGALIELPWASSPRHLGWQPVHGRPMLGGMWEVVPAFQPPEAVALREDPFVAGLIALGRGMDATPGDPGPAGALGYRFVVLQRDELPRGETAPIRQRRRHVEQRLRAALGEPLWDDARTVVWSPWGAPSPCRDAPPAPDRAPGEVLRDRAVVVLGTVDVR